MKLAQESSAEYLRSAQPRLICRVEPQGDLRFKITPYIQNEGGCDGIISEGYDPDHSPLGRPVYWRIVKRGDEQFYWSTFVATRDQVVRTWGPGALVYCEATSGTAVARIETKLPGSAL
jgi:hypothetical protein